MYKVGGGGRAQKKSEAVGRRLGAGPAWLFLRSSGVLSTPHLGFCRGSKGTREEPSGLSSRLRSDFLNSAGGQETTSSAIPSTPPPNPPTPRASPHHFLFLTRCLVVGQAKGHLLGVQRRRSTGLWGKRKKDNFLLRPRVHIITWPAGGPIGLQPTKAALETETMFM